MSEMRCDAVVIGAGDRRIAGLVGDIGAGALAGPEKLKRRLTAKARGVDERLKRPGGPVLEGAGVSGVLHAAP